MLALYPQNAERACPRLLPSPWGPCGLCGELGVCGWRRVKARHLERGNKRQRPGHPQAPRGWQKPQQGLLSPPARAGPQGLTCDTELAETGIRL